MPDIRFYHLTRRTAEQALPELVDRAYHKGHKILVRCGNARDVAAVNDTLWTFHPDAFLPHGAAGDGQAARQPIFLTEGDDNPAGADVLMLMPGAGTDGIEAYKLCCVLFNGQNETEISTARALWKGWKEAGHPMTYWQQSDQGKWEQKQ